VNKILLDLITCLDCMSSLGSLYTKLQQLRLVGGLLHDVSLVQPILLLLYLHTEAHASSPDVRQVIWFSLPYGGISVSDKPSSVCAVPAYAASVPFSCQTSCCIHRLRTLFYFCCCWSGCFFSNYVKKTFRFGNFMLRSLGIPRRFT
jgi:hypothetical protein